MMSDPLLPGWVVTGVSAPASTEDHVESRNEVTLYMRKIRVSHVGDVGVCVTISDLGRKVFNVRTDRRKFTRCETQHLAPWMIVSKLLNFMPVELKCCTDYTLGCNSKCEPTEIAAVLSGNRLPVRGKDILFCFFKAAPVSGRKMRPIDKSNSGVNIILSVCFPHGFDPSHRRVTSSGNYEGLRLTASGGAVCNPTVNRTGTKKYRSVR